MKYLKVFTLVILAASFVSCSRGSKSPDIQAKFKDTRVVLQVADNKLTLGEVEKNFSTTEFRAPQDEFEQKRGYVEQTMDRFLLIEGAREAGIVPVVDSATVRRYLLKNLYNEKILSKIEVRDKDINEFFSKYGGEVQAGHILVTDSTLADSLYKALQKGANYEQLAQEFSIDTQSKTKGGSLGYVSYGRFDDKFQEAAFGLKMGEISRPVHTRYGWHIIKLFDRIKNTRQDLEQSKKSYSDFTYQYLQKTKVSKFINDVKSDVRYEIVRPTLDLLIHSADSVKATTDKPRDLPSSAYLDPAAFSDAQKGLFLVKYDGGGVTVNEFFDLLRGYAPQRAPELRDMDILSQLLEGIALPKVLEKIAYQEKIDQAETYKNDIKYFEGSYLAQKMREKIMSTLGEILEEDIQKYYAEHRGEFFLPDQMRASGIAMKNQKEALDLLERARGGANFAQLAKKYSVDKKTGSEGGDLNYFTVARNTPIYKAAEGMAIGDIGGPVQMDGNWWIFKVTGRITKTPKELSLVRPDITSKIGAEWRNKAYADWIAAQKAKSQYKMDMDLIKSTLNSGSLDGSGKSDG